MFDGFWGIWTPKCCRPSCGPLKCTSFRHNACFEPWCVKFHARVTSVGESGKKNKNKKERPYTSRISPGAPLRPIGTNFGLRVRLVDAINCAKFYRNRLRGLDSVRGWIWPFPLDCDVAVNTVWTTVHTVVCPCDLDLCPFDLGVMSCDATYTTFVLDTYRSRVRTTTIFHRLPP